MYKLDKENIPEKIREDYKRLFPTGNIEQAIDKFNNMSIDEFKETCKQFETWHEKCFEKENEERLEYMIDYMERFPFGKNGLY